MVEVPVQKEVLPVMAGAGFEPIVVVAEVLPVHPLVPVTVTV